MASLSEQKYLTLRKRLDQFGFKQPLAIESLPLVEKLFQAFIQTTEELKKAKEVCVTFKTAVSTKRTIVCFIQ